MTYVVGVSQTTHPESIMIREYQTDMDAMDACRDWLVDEFPYVSGVYYCASKKEMIDNIKRDGWWFIHGEEQEE